MLNKCYGEDDLESFSGVLNIVTAGWQNLPALSLREAAKHCNPKKNDFNTGRCKCKNTCKDWRCAFSVPPSATMALLAKINLMTTST